jgi:threonine dehydrogenase-like Zn-dependent dehydrogenase
VEGADVTGRARAFWLREPGYGEIRWADLPDPGPGEVLVRTVASGVSRGTESLVFKGGVPVSQYDVMRAPFQEGDFPGPLKYGYLSVGVVEAGEQSLVGSTVFCLHPHQTAYVVPAAAVTVVPDDVPPRRAVLAGAVETAVNALWDAGPLVGDRATLVDVDTSREKQASGLGVRFATPDEAPRDLDLVLHASGTSAGLQLSLDLLGADGTVTDLSWYGDAPVTLDLGGSFHSSRLGIRASQVGRVAAARRDRRSTADRLELALSLLADPAYDVLLTGESAFGDLPEVMPRLASGDLPALCHTIAYDQEEPACSR